MEEFRRSKRAIAEDSYFKNTNRKLDILNLKVRMVKHLSCAEFFRM